MRAYGRFLLLLLMLTACGGGEDDIAPIPTAFRLDSPTPSPLSPPTLPPTWTFTPSITPTGTLSPTVTLTVTPSATITDTPTPTATPSITPTADVGAVSLLAELARAATVLPQNFSAVPPPSSAPSGQMPTVTGGCAILPAGGFATAFLNNPAVAAQIGCPAGSPPVTASLGAAVQIYERGLMIWLSPNSIYALLSDGSFLRFDDTFDPNSDPYSGGEVPPPNLLEPVRGFGKVWRTYVNVKGALGWGVTAETATQAVVQAFDRGRMIYLTGRSDILVLLEQPGGITGRWVAITGGF